MKLNCFLVAYIFLISNNFCTAQYFDIPVKEEYDFYNLVKFNHGYTSCTIDENNDSAFLGDHLSKLLEGYIIMYQTTQDKAYLYKFLFNSLCILNNRHDMIQFNNPPRWSHDPNMYQDGYILAALARFTYLVNIEFSSLYNTEIYQFEKMNPLLYDANTCNCNSFGIDFLTFGQFSDWLQDRVGEAMYWYLSNGYWSNSVGFTKFPGDGIALDINMQIGFGRALLFNGLTSNNSDFLQKADIIASLFLGGVNFYDQCKDEFYNSPVLIQTIDNSYWWYHRGWRVERSSYWCPSNSTYYFNSPKLDAYTEFIEDISHGAIVTWLPLDFYRFQVNSPFSINDMIRFRNMFTKHVYDGVGGFNEAVDGNNGPVYPDNELDVRALDYMLFSNFDEIDSSTVPPNVYDIVFQFYLSSIADSLNQQYASQDNKGHAEIVQAQWNNECPNLTIFNRRVVYNQDFFSKGKLIFAPMTSNYSSFAEPKIFEQVFEVEPFVSVQAKASESVTLKSGTHIKFGAEFHAFIDESLCEGSKSIDNLINKANLIEHRTNDYILNRTSLNLNIFPNPIEENVNIEFSLSNEFTVTLTLHNSLGQIFLEPIEQKLLSAGNYSISLACDKLPPGVYYCILTFDNCVFQSKRFIKI